MSSHSHKPAIVIPDPKGYESADLDLAPIIKWMAMLEVFVLVSTLITVPIYRFFLPKTTIGDVTRFTERTLPPEPKLQAQPKIELKDFRMDEQARMESYGWAEKSKGEMRMPLEKAMEMVVQNGAEGVVMGTPAVKPAPEPVTIDAPEVDKPANGAVKLERPAKKTAE